MTKLKKYLKPFIWGIIASIALLFTQAICELVVTPTEFSTGVSGKTTAKAVLIG
jgi:hypothetical protein